MYRLRSKFSSLLVAALFTSLVASCGGGAADPNAAGANAGCEAPTDALLTENETMLPGRACMNCHKAGGQASGAAVQWTVAGTVFASNSAACNPGGLSGVKVEILDMNGAVQFSLLTNTVGNFYTTQPVAFPFRARVSMGSKTQTMVTPMSTGNCPSCHQIPPLNASPGRISLN